jgi:hypothetical protein
VSDLNRLADQFDRAAATARANARDHHQAGNLVGQAVATGAAETWESAAEQLRAALAEQPDTEPETPAGTPKEA